MSHGLPPEAMLCICFNNEMIIWAPGARGAQATRLVMNLLKQLCSGRHWPPGASSGKFCNAFIKGMTIWCAMGYQVFLESGTIDLEI